MAMYRSRAWVAFVLLAAGTWGESGAVAGDGQDKGQGKASRPGPKVMDARSLAGRIDSVMAAKWAEAKVRPVPAAEDGEFLRRVGLDLVGKIPTASEASDFLDDPSKDKRAALVERLLDSPAYTARATELWRKLLLPESETEDRARQFAAKLRWRWPRGGHRGRSYGI